MAADRTERTPEPAPPDTPTPGADEPVSFTAEELRQMDADGLTLAAAIRAIESRPG